MMRKNPDTADSFSKMLISVLVHDLRQPFASLISAADMIKYADHPLSEEELYMIFDHMRHTASKSIKLLDGLVFWMKSQNSGYTCQTQSLPLRDLINSANGLYIHDQASKSISISNTIPEHQLIHANKEMLQFINRNILSNATKYSPPGGTINISCSVEDARIIVAFADQGMGIREEQLERLFSIQDTPVLDSHYLQGAGIALSICQDMIRQMNGKLWAESAYGHGATFFYSLPLPA
ncbi:sensor histidine kinase [Chitinophaga qingshengii]|uniref:histidine kinase n=1 Tax=Chitinophaga qingshengii TaxID=1569794 RepID=A0ABR7TSQ5_9BACT|nr:ATP-binding protein [Chitinophaga qingshengii]MBC9932680.1 hypothetical protein [Chitinophaga qingshengii]